MIRENRYIVLKLKDVDAYLMPAQAAIIERLGNIVANGRKKDGKIPLQCVVVESDWTPEFEQVWAMIAARVDGTMISSDNSSLPVVPEHSDTDCLYPDVESLKAHLNSLHDEGGQGGEKWEPAQAALRGIELWEAGELERPDYPAIFCFADDVGQVFAGLVRSRIELNNAVTRWMYDGDTAQVLDDLSDENQRDEVIGIADELLERGHFQPEGDKGCWLRKA